MSLRQAQSVGPPTPQDADVIVIGAGHNGLVAACYLARAGLDVLVVEAAGWIGGSTTTSALIAAAPEHRINPCAADICLLRASTVVSDLGLCSFGYREIDLDPFYVSLDHDGGSLAFWRDPRKTADELRHFNRNDGDNYLEFARALNSAMKIVRPLLLTNPTRPAPRNLLRALAGAVRHPREMAMLAMLCTTTAEEAIRELFEHPIIQGPLATIAGTGGPITSPGTGYSLLFMGLLHSLGIGRVVGGTQALPDALVRCLSSAGGRVRTASPVAELIVRAGSVTGVRLGNGEELTARAVVASCDPRTTLSRLLPAGVLPHRLSTRAAHIPTTNGGAAFMKVDLALRGWVQLPTHQAQRSDGVDLRRPAHLVGTLEEMRASLEQAALGNLADPAPFVGLIPTAADPSQAPAGQDTLYLWQGWVPFTPSEPWSTFGDTAAKAMLTRAGQFYDGIESLEIGRFLEPWPLLAERTRAPDGNPWHVDIGLFNMGPLRPARGFGGYRTPVPGLFLTGGGTHPGPSVSGIPGQLAARTVLRTIKVQSAR